MSVRTEIPAAQPADAHWPAFDEASALAQAGRWPEAIARFDELLNESISADMRAHIHNDLGVAHQSLGALDPAIAHFRQSHEIYEHERNRLGAAIALGNLGAAYVQSREWDAAITCFERSLTVFDNLKIDNLAVAKLRVDMGDALAAAGKPKAACEQYELALKRQTAEDDRRAMALTLHALGAAMRARQRWEEGIAAFQRSIELFEALGDRPSVGTTMNRLGELYYERRDYENAIASYERDLEISESLQNRRAAAQTAGNLGLAHLALGHDKPAAAQFKRALDLYQQMDDDHGVAMALWGRAQLHFDREERDEALKEGGRALALFERTRSEADVEAVRKWMAAVRRGRRTGLRRYF